jgi:hypothetical protein
MISHQHTAAITTLTTTDDQNSSGELCISATSGAEWLRGAIIARTETPRNSDARSETVDASAVATTDQPVSDNLRQRGFRASASGSDDKSLNNRRLIDEGQRKDDRTTNTCGDTAFVCARPCRLLC